MSIELPELSEEGFARRLGSVAPVGLAPASVRAMYVHYGELRRWSRTVALIGGGMAGSVVERLFGESLAALSLVGESSRVLVDVGSGAGFPGLVIAAARPDVQVVLMEPRQRKWAFLRSVADKAALSCRCVNARVAAALPSELPMSFDRVTVRALRLGRPEMCALAERLSPGGAFLLWASGGLAAPEGFRERQAVLLRGGRGRVLQVVPE